MLRIDDGDDGIDEELLLHVVVHEERLHDGAGIREAVVSTSTRSNLSFRFMRRPRMRM